MEKQAEMNGVIREMTDCDMESVLSILNAAILDGNSTSRYVCPTKEEWEESLIPTCRYVYEEKDEVLGFVVLHPFSQRPCYSGVAEISIYMAARVRGRGIGKRLLQKEIDESAKQGFWYLTSNIYTTNEASCRLHEALGFRRVGYRDRLMKTKNGEWMSVVIYELRIQETPGRRCDLHDGK